MIDKKISSDRLVTGLPSENPTLHWPPKLGVLEPVLWQDILEGSALQACTVPAPRWPLR